MCEVVRWRTVKEKGQYEPENVTSFSKLILSFVWYVQIMQNDLLEFVQVYENNVNVIINA